MPRRVSNPPNPWLPTHLEYLDVPPEAELEVYEETARSVLSRNESPDIPFRWSLNPYRGCFHACAYCYARPTHQYLGWGAGTDFDRRIVVKTNVAEVLSLELGRPSWKRETVTLSGNTDCYQPLEAGYGLTRRCLEVLLARRTPAVVVTKAGLVRRDADLLARLAQGPGCTVFVSIPFLDDGRGRLLEPGASAPSVRFDALRVLSEAGVPVGVAFAPLIPGLNDADVAGVLERAAECGAKSAFLTLLRLPAEVLPVFDERLRAAFPDRADKVRAALRDMRRGSDYDGRFGARMLGRGPRWEAVRSMYEMQCRRLGLNRAEGVEPVADKEPRVEQRELF